VLEGLKSFAASDAGMLIVTGPAGSGKTTTIYALLRHIAQTQSGISIVTLEDPVERDLQGIVQIEVSPFGQLSYERALRSILRQDPQVLMLGEIRDAATASIAIQAALSGHRLICTLHAATPAGALVRLLEMGIEPYQLTSALHVILTQRLLRTLSPTAVPERSGGLHVEYHGRIPIAELVTMSEELRRALLSRCDIDTLRRSYESQPSFRPLRWVADHLLSEGLTDESEILRVLGTS
jgi:type II secretory ATPase GspE/PulE/Tfp pilus assembly ATPase PilB-like protein